MLDDHWFAHTPKLFTTHNAHIQWIIVCNRGYFLVFAIAMVMTVVVMTVVVMIVVVMIVVVMIMVSTTANEQAGGNKGSGN